MSNVNQTPAATHAASQATGNVAASLPAADTKIEPIKLDETQKRKWIETRTAVLWRCPAFTHILFSMMNPTKGELAAIFTESVPIAATDGVNLILNPKTFFAMPLDQRVFVVAHEILHCVLNHCVLSQHFRRTKTVKYVDGSSLPYNHQTMNKAMDYVINDTLIADKIGEFPPMGLHDVSIATRADNFVDAYRKVYDDEQKNGQGQSGGFDVVLQPGAGSGQSPDAAAQSRSQTEWDTAVAAAISSAKLQGKLPGNLERLLSEIVEPTVPWQDHIRAFFARKVGSGGYDWRKPDRRLIMRDIYAPQRAGNGCGLVVVGIDTSGSIGQKELNVFFAEMRGILEDVRPQMIHVVWCDSKVHKVDEVEEGSDIDGLKPAGGGGTDFVPVFDYIAGLPAAPDALVYLTDGMGRFPDSAPPYPVVWGNIYKGAKYPFGDVVEVELK